MQDWIFLLIGFAAGITGTFFATKFYIESKRVLTRFEKEQLDQELSNKEVEKRIQSESINNLLKELEALKIKVDEERQKSYDLSNKLTAKEGDFNNLEEKLTNHKEEVENLQKKFSNEFKNLANEILEEKSKKFTDLNKVNIGEILNPLKEKISEFEKKVDSTNKESIDRNAALKQQLKTLSELNLKITKDAENLTKALKGESKTQGNWGEFILESILEKSGLVKGREYKVQESFSTDSGRLQPDVIINLPDNKNIIIDSKVSLVAYERYISAEDEIQQKINLKEHVGSLRKHIKDLSAKNYQQVYNVSGLDFVLLFMPIEPAFGLAIQHDDQLFMDAYEKNIVIVSPSTLIATLRTIASIWRQEYQNSNAIEIARQSGSLYDKFKAFTDDLIKIGDNLGTTRKNYEQAMNKLTDGKDNLVRKTERLKVLGAKASKSIDQRLIERSGVNEIE
jgi:DNA recombination protein RmuC